MEGASNITTSRIMETRLYIQWNKCFAQADRSGPMAGPLTKVRGTARLFHYVDIVGLVYMI